MVEVSGVDSLVYATGIHYAQLMLKLNNLHLKRDIWRITLLLNEVCKCEHTHITMYDQTIHVVLENTLTLNVFPFLIRCSFVPAVRSPFLYRKTFGLIFLIFLLRLLGQRETFMTSSPDFTMKPQLHVAFTPLLQRACRAWTY